MTGAFDQNLISGVELERALDRFVWRPDIDPDVLKNLEPTPLDNERAVVLWQTVLKTNPLGVRYHIFLNDEQFVVQERRYADAVAHSVPGWDVWWEVVAPTFSEAVGRAVFIKACKEHQ